GMDDRPHEGRYIGFPLPRSAPYSSFILGAGRRDRTRPRGCSRAQNADDGEALRAPWRIAPEAGGRSNEREGAARLGTHPLFVFATAESSERRRKTVCGNKLQLNLFGIARSN